MACGTPIVVSNVSSIPEIVGEAAVLTNARDVQSLAEGIYHVLSNNTFKSHLIKQGIQRVKNFSWEISVKKTLALYESEYEKHQKKRTVKIETPIKYYLINELEQIEHREKGGTLQCYKKILSRRVLRSIILRAMRSSYIRTIAQKLLRTRFGQYLKNKLI